MIEQSISIKKATDQTNIHHNNREMKPGEKKRNAHIDWSRTQQNVLLLKKDIKKLYEFEFGPSVEKYNAKQKRNDRKIKDYYEKIHNSAKTKEQHELIIQIGSREDYQIRPFEDMEFPENSNFNEASWKNVEEKRVKDNWLRSNQILKEWYVGFAERNPNLKVYNAVIHNDESSPHIHLNFVPVAMGYKRGMEKQVSFDKALLQQDKTLDKMQPFEAWRQKELEVIEQNLKKYGLQRKIVGTNEYKDLDTFKRRMALQNNVAELEKKVRMISFKKKDIEVQTKQTTDEYIRKLTLKNNMDQAVKDAQEAVQYLEQQRLRRKKAIEQLDEELEKREKAYKERVAEIKKNADNSWNTAQREYKAKLDKLNKELLEKHQMLQKKDRIIKALDNKIEGKQKELSDTIENKQAQIETLEKTFEAQSKRVQLINKKLLESIPSQKEKIPFSHYEVITEVTHKTLGKDKYVEVETDNVVLTPEQVKIVQNKIHAATYIKDDYEKMRASNPIQERNKAIQEHDALQNKYKKSVSENEDLKSQNTRLKNENNDLLHSLRIANIELEGVYRGVRNFVDKYFKNPKTAMQNAVAFVKESSHMIFNLNNESPRVTRFEKYQKRQEERQQIQDARDKDQGPEL